MSMTIITDTLLSLSHVTSAIETAPGSDTLCLNTGTNLLKRTEPNLSRLTIYPSYSILFIFLKALQALPPVILNHIDWTTRLYDVSLPIFNKLFCKLIVLLCIVWLWPLSGCLFAKEVVSSPTCWFTMRVITLCGSTAQYLVICSNMSDVTRRNDPSNYLNEYKHCHCA